MPVRSPGRVLAPLVALLFIAGPSSAGSFDGGPKILLHVASVTAKNACAAGQILDCSDAVTTGGLYPPGYFVYLLATRGDVPTLSAIQCGISYDGHDPNGILDGDGIDIFDWALCATIEFITPTPPWPRPGCGGIIIWDDDEACQTGDVSVAGYFYVAAYSPDTLRVTRRPVDNATKMATCASEEIPMEGTDLGYAVFTNVPGAMGCNPCDGPCPDFILPPPPPPDPPPPETPPRILLHVGATTSKNACAAGQLADCEDADVSGSLVASPAGPFYFVYLLATPGQPPPMGSRYLGGLQVGITYDGNEPAGITDGNGIDVFGWVNCATLEFPSASPAWPAPGSGNVITWNDANCQTGNIAVAGYFYVGAYTDDVLKLVPRQLDGLAKVARCDAFEIIVPEEDLGYVAFSTGGTTGGCNPCLEPCADPTPVVPTTWSGIKSLIGR